MSTSIRETIHEVTDQDIHVKDCSDHHKVFTNELQPFEVDILQTAFKDNGYSSHRFDNDGVQFLKVHPPHQ